MIILDNYQIPTENTDSTIVLVKIVNGYRYLLSDKKGIMEVNPELGLIKVDLSKTEVFKVDGDVEFCDFKLSRSGFTNVKKLIVVVDITQHGSLFSWMDEGNVFREDEFPVDINTSAVNLTAFLNQLKDEVSQSLYKISVCIPEEVTDYGYSPFIYFDDEDGESYHIPPIETERVFIRKYVDGDTCFVSGLAVCNTLPALKSLCRKLDASYVEFDKKILESHITVCSEEINKLKESKDFRKNILSYHNTVSVYYQKHLKEFESTTDKLVVLTDDCGTDITWEFLNLSNFTTKVFDYTQQLKQE